MQILKRLRAVIREPSEAELRLLALLVTYADRNTGRCWPSRRTLAADLGWTARHVRRTLARLRARGFVRVERVGRREEFVVLPERTPNLAQPMFPPIVRAPVVAAPLPDFQDTLPRAVRLASVVRHERPR